jgi:ribosome-binding factor A
MPTHHPTSGRGGRAGDARPAPLRARRLAETIKRLVTAWLDLQERRENLPGFVTVTDVRVNRDASHAKVYYTLLGPEPTAALQGGEAATAEAAHAADQLADVAPQVRAWVAQHLRVRHAPTIEFVPDDVAASGARIEQILDDLSGTHGTPTGGDVTDPTDPSKGSQP